ncbi:hypothetical protein Xenpb_01675 [Xenorhabdus sp. PB62.4]|nr:hypothetical protein [Xenorhabdus sp. PB62.4]
MTLKNMEKPKKTGSGNFWRYLMEYPVMIPSTMSSTDSIRTSLATPLRLYAFTAWVKSLANLTKDIIALDGKTMRSTLDKAKDVPAIHLVSA